jgi:hypothetical protein
MFERETRPSTDVDPMLTAWLDTTFVQLDSTVSSSAYVNVHTSQVVSATTLHDMRALWHCRGGLLADEMGLGKTVEVLALWLAHPRPGYSCWTMNEDADKGDASPQSHDKRVHASENHDECTSKRARKDIGVQPAMTAQDTQDPNNNTSAISCFCGSTRIRQDDRRMHCTSCRTWQHALCVNWDDEWNDDAYLCPRCAVDTVYDSGATLIVAPESICFQWRDEISKHVRDTHSRLRVMVSDGRTCYVRNLNSNIWERSGVSFNRVS